MKKILTIIGLAAATLAGANAAVVITEVMSSSAHGGGTNNADWFELTNTGLSAADITGWSWDDDTVTPGSAGFGSITSIGAGRSIIFNGETLGAEASWISNWGLSGVTVVNLGGTIFQSISTTGDQVNIYDASNSLVASVSFGTATTGFSFEWDSSGNFLGLSAIGENGAFQAVSNGQTTGLGAGVDVGSPGLVPEPKTWALIGIGTSFMLWNLRRRRRIQG